MADVTSSDGHCGTRLHTAWASVLIWTDLTGARTVLRNGVAIGAIPAGGIAYYDHFPPLGANATYQVSNGATTSTAAVQPIPADANHRTWLKSAKNPNLSLALTQRPLDDQSQDQALGVFTPAKGGNRFVIFGALGQRDTTLTFAGYADTQRDSLVALVASAAPIYYQPDPVAGEVPMWVAVSRMTRSWVQASSPGAPGVDHFWELALQVLEVPAPSLPGTIIPGWGWDNVKATWATSNALRSANATGLALIQYGVS